VPEAGKIRNSNGPMLAAAVAACGATPLPLGIAPDEPQQLRAKISQGLEADVLLLSGGVSAGKLDLVPETLTGLAVSQVFHKINLKPGKPLWFGVKDDDRGPRLVFGLPGNPVSAFVCFHLFVRLALSRLAGGDETSIPHVAATLAAEYDQRGDRATYYPAQLDGSAVAPIPWRGSADLRGFAAANALIHFPPGARRHQAGEQVEVLPL
jgi:molybdopterin molybdotransferase